MSEDKAGRPNRQVGNNLRNSWSMSPGSTEEEEEVNTLLNDRARSESNPVQPGPTHNLSHTSTYIEDKMRRRLRFFFMNPIEKWQAKRRFPYKLIIQVIKIFLVTTQLCLFAHNNYMHVNYAWDNRIAFSHLFLKGWDVTLEVPAYPPATGPLALYQKMDFFETIDYALAGYYNLNNTIGSYSYNTKDNSVGLVALCLYHYEEATIFGFNRSYIFNNKIVETCLNITEQEGLLLSSTRLLQQRNIQVNFSSLIRAKLMFSLRTVNLMAAGVLKPPDCYEFKISVLFNNKDFDGQMLLSLDAQPMRLICQEDTKYITDDQIQSALITLLNIFVIFICTTSLLLCSRAIYRAQLLKYETMAFFKKVYGKPLSLEGRLEFLNLWYLTIIINDLLIILGSAIKQEIENKQFSNDHWSLCSICLGTGNLLVWFGVLRYLGFFKTYNVVILTMKKAFPQVVRFLFCAILIYAGFTFCGWLVLGPYHIKFRSLATTSECLFALINGDELFATFSIISFKSPMMWWFSRIYLYSFISLYIYVVLSLFISIIMDAYDTIKLYYRDGFPKNDLQSFISICTDTASSGLYRDEKDDNWFDDLLAKCCSCCTKNDKSSFNPLSTQSSRNSDSTIESTQVSRGLDCV